MNKNIFIWIVFIVNYFNLNPAQAQETKSAISSSTAGSGRSAVEAPDNLYLNPAMQVHLRGRHFYFGHFQTKLSREMNILLADNSPDALMPASLAYLQRKLETTLGQVTESSFALSVAEFGGVNWSIGLTGRTIQSEIVGSSVQYRQNTADLGFSFIPSAQLGFGLVFYNVYQEDEIPSSLKRRSSIGAGLTYLLNSANRYRLDLVTGPDSNLAQGRLEAGFESMLNNWIVFRFGLAQGFEGKDSNLLSAGLGFRGPRFHLNYAFQKPEIEEKEGAHTIDFIVPF